MEADSFIPLDPVHAVSTDMQNETKRMLTFGDWSRKHQKQPQDLIPAGFFYTGDGDKVQYFSCGGCIAGWNINDDPWFEHARLHPTCQFVIENKGQFYIDQIQKAEYVEILKQDFRTFATKRGFNQYDIDQVLDQLFESEAHMREAILNMSEYDYKMETVAVDEEL